MSGIILPKMVTYTKLNNDDQIKNKLIKKARNQEKIRPPTDRLSDYLMSLIMLVNRCV